MSEDKIMRIDKVAAVFQVIPAGLPISQFKVKVLEQGNGKYLGVMDVAIKNPKTGFPEETSGLGDSVDSALQDAVKYFFTEIETNPYDRPLEEDDFEWNENF